MAEHSYSDVGGGEGGGEATHCLVHHFSRFLLCSVETVTYSYERKKTS